MNQLERTMLETLIDLRETYHAVGIKCEFEAEGTRQEEAQRLKEICTLAGLPLTIKIGGGEALNDLYQARNIGVQRIVAPMIESAYALKKFVQAARIAFPVDDPVELLINVETYSAVAVFLEMMNMEEARALAGIVLGRVDLTGSLGIPRDDVNCDRVLAIAKEILTLAKERGKQCVIGGGVSKYSIPFFRNLSGLLDRFETRKIIFDAPKALGNNAERGIMRAVGFELMWLKNKKNYYGAIYTEDDSRIEMLERRYAREIEEAGGRYA